MPDKASVNKDHLHFSNLDYFMAGAEDVNIASYGIKRKDPTIKRLNPLRTKGDHVEVHGTLQLKNAKAQQVASIELDQKTNVDVKGSAKGTVQVANVPVKVTASTSGEHKNTETNTVKLVKMVMDMKTIAEQLNADLEAVVDMMQGGKDSRIVNEVFIVVAAKMDDTLSDNGSVTLDAGTTTNPVVNVSASLDASATKDKSMTLTLAKDQIFAYSTLRFSDGFLKDHYEKDQVKLNAKFDEKNPPKLRASDFTSDHFGKG
jgi:hypothetical protein